MKKTIVSTKELEKALETYKPRPENAVPSRKKDQRFAEEARQTLKERKRLKVFQEKKKEEESRIQNRANLFSRLQATALPRADRDGLSGSSNLAKPIANKSRDEGKVGKRHRKREDKRATVVVSSPQSSSSSSSSESENEDIPPASLESALIKQESSSDEEEEEEYDEQVHDDGLEVSVPPPIVMEVVDPALNTAFVVSPSRTPEVEASRSALTICSMEQEIMESVKEHDVVFICGETGSGKTTQVPQMLLEAGFGCVESPFPHRIGVTQPRRFAAISVAERVGMELNCPVSSHRGEIGNRTGREAKDLLHCVGYQIRHDASTVIPEANRIKFMTDGILLAEIKEDFLLSQYSVLVLDEVHERGLNSDLLLGLLSKMVPLRNELFRQGKASRLKVILMSATMALEDFQPLFPSAPVLLVEGNRPFTVTPHFSKRTEQVDYLKATFKKCCQVHEKLACTGQGDGILVFLTGQREIEWFCAKLRQKYNHDEKEEILSGGGEEELELGQLGEDDDDFDKPSRSFKKDGGGKRAHHQEHDESSSSSSSSSNESDFSGGEDADTTTTNTATTPSCVASVFVVPLYSRLSAEKQKMIFQKPIASTQRLIVVSTNVAETSLTIPGIKYVVDSGREKKRVFDQRTGTSSFRVGFISQTSAIQRMGRAGRTTNGHCYRLYSPAVYENQFDKKSLPETCSVPIDDLILYMKQLGIAKLESFPFPTKLDGTAIHSSLIRLKQLGALNEQDQITPLGEELSALPIGLRLAKTLVLVLKDAACARMVNHTLLLCALLSLASPFEQSPKVHFQGDCSSDALSLLRAGGAFSHDPSSSFCRKFQLHFKTMQEAQSLCKQLAQRTTRKNRVLEALPVLPSSLETLLKQAIVAGSIDRIAKLVPLVKGNVCKPRDCAYLSCDEQLNGKPLFIHPHSVLLTHAEEEEFSLPEFVQYTSVSEEGRMEGLTVVDPKWLRKLSLGTNQCKDELLETPEPVYDSQADEVFGFVKPKFGSLQWALPLERVPLLGVSVKLATQCFARSLLEGKVVGALVPVISAFVDPPAHCTRMPFQPRVSALVNKLLKANVCTRQNLIHQLEQDGNFLLSELLAWVKQKEEKAELETAWRAVLKKKNKKI